MITAILLNQKFKRRAIFRTLYLYSHGLYRIIVQNDMGLDIES